MSLLGSVMTIMSFACLGAITGYVHLALIYCQIRALLSQAEGAWTLAALARFPMTAAAFALAAVQGILPLAAALAGFLIIRTVLFRRPERLMS